jgi:hypothetical protein
VTEELDEHSEVLLNENPDIDQYSNLRKGEDGRASVSSIESPDRGFKPVFKTRNETGTNPF